jgi:hypothetical protein
MMIDDLEKTRKIKTLKDARNDRLGDRLQSTYGLVFCSFQSERIWRVIFGFPANTVNKSQIVLRRRTNKNLQSQLVANNDIKSIFVTSWSSLLG